MVVGFFVLGLELPKKESKSASTVESALPTKLELVFETGWVSGVDSLTALLPRPRCPKGLFLVLAVVDLATFGVLLLLISVSMPVLATVSFLFSQVNGSGSDDVTFTGLVALTLFESAEA